MPDFLRILAPLFLAAQAIAVYLAAATERPPAPPDLSRFPSAINGWKQLRDEPVATELGADRTLSRTYFQNGSSANLLVAWFQSQRSGNRQPHSPKVCLPAAGWTPQSSSELQAGGITVNRYLVTKGRDRAVVLYWYQSPRRVVAGEWASKLWLVADALRDHRTDTALVRVIVWVTGAGEEAATTNATRFAAQLYPVLNQTLPAISDKKDSTAAVLPPPRVAGRGTASLTY